MGKVYLVGAGPGDIKLITIRGLELIRRADVIIYDNLVNKGLLEFARAGAEIIYAGKKGVTPRTPAAGDKLSPGRKGIRQQYRRHG